MTYKEKFEGWPLRHKLCVCSNYKNSLDSLRPSVRKVVEEFINDNKEAVEAYKE